MLSKSLLNFFLIFISYYWNLCKKCCIISPANDAVVEWQTRYFEGVVGQPV